MTDRMSDAENRLARIDRLLADGEREVVPAWRRATQGEPRWAVIAVILVAVAIQLMLLHRLAFQPYWVLPTLELVMLAGVIAGEPPAGRTPHPVAAPAGPGPDVCHQPRQRLGGGPAGGGPRERHRGQGRRTAAAVRRRPHW